MKIRISYTVEVPDRYRKAINARKGKPGMATRDEVRNFIELYGESMDDDLLDEFDSKEVSDE